MRNSLWVGPSRLTDDFLDCLPAELYTTIIRRTFLCFGTGKREKQKGAYGWRK